MPNSSVINLFWENMSFRCSHQLVMRMTIAVFNSIKYNPHFMSTATSSSVSELTVFEKFVHILLQKSKNAKLLHACVYIHNIQHISYPISKKPEKTNINLSYIMVC